MAMKTLKRTLKLAAALVGIATAGALIFAVMYLILWGAFYAGIPM